MTGVRRPERLLRSLRARKRLGLDGPHRAKPQHRGFTQRGRRLIDDEAPVGREDRRGGDRQEIAQGRERLILTPEPKGGGGKEKATDRLIWERQQLAPLSVEQKKFVGFWKLLYTDDYRTKGAMEVFHGFEDKPGGKDTHRAGTSYIIYTDSGHMMVILMDNSGRTRYEDAQPTALEALKAWTSIAGYFGRFVTYENQTPPYVIHSQQGATTPGTYSEQQRFYQFTGDVLRLGGPPNLNDAGELSGGHLYWQKMKAGER